MFWWCLEICASFSITYIIIKKKFKNRHAWPVLQSCSALPTSNEGLALNPVFCPTSSSTYQKHLKLGQCLEIDDRRPLSKFGDFTLPSSNFTDRSVFYRPTIYRLVCKIVNLLDMDLKFLEPISYVINIDNGAKSWKVTILRRYIFRNELFEHILTLQTHNGQTRWVISKVLADFELDIWLKYHGHTANGLRKVTPLFTCKPKWKHLLVNHMYRSTACLIEPVL